MPQLFTNNARAVLTAGITSTATSLTVEAVKADTFPAANVGTGTLPSANNWFKAVLQDALGNVEIVYVRSRTAGSGVFSNVLRGQEGTTARAFAAGDVVGLRLTAADLNSSFDLTSKNNLFTGNNTFSGSTEFTGSSTFTGAASFVNTITGSISGNAGTVTNGVYTTGNQTIGGVKTFSSGTVVANAFSYSINSSTGAANAMVTLSNANVAQWGAGGATESHSWWAGGVSRMTLDGAGNLTATGDITAFSDERLKTNWRELDAHFLSDLATVKIGIYERKDTGETQVGASAQSMQRILPQSVREDVSGHLSVAYGSAALVSCVMLAREVEAIKAKLGI